jgi:hypothetical protein
MPAPLRHERQRAEDTLRAAGLHLKASWVDQVKHPPSLVSSIYHLSDF